MCSRFFIFYIFLVVFANAKIDGKYRYDYTYYKAAGGWLKLHIAPATFQDAFLRCNLEGAVLASPLNEHIQRAMVDIQTTSNQQCPMYTGVHSTISKGDFTSIEGVPLEKIPLKWALNEPDNYENQEECIVMLRNGSVADTRCNETYPYVCYRKKTSSPVITVCGTVDIGYTFDGRTAKCYKFHQTGQSWRRAQKTCLAEGGHLAIIRSATDVEVLKSIFAKNPASSINSAFKDIVSLGFLDWDRKRSWFTVNGQTLEEAGYSKWSNGQPDNSKAFDDGQHCGGMFRTGLLDDVWCDSVPFAFICEKTPESLISDDE